MLLSKAALVATLTVITINTFAIAFDSSIHPCPAPCSGKPENWTLYTSVDRLKVCYQPMLLDFSLHAPLDAPTTAVKLFTCNIGNASIPSQVDLLQSKALLNQTFQPTDNEATGTLDITISLSESSVHTGEHDFILASIQSYVSEYDHRDTSSLFGYLNGTAVGMYSGEAIDNPITSSSIIQNLRDQTKSLHALQKAIVQLCEPGRNADHTFGVVVDTTGDMAAVQKLISAWSNSQCVVATGYKIQISGFPIHEKSLRQGHNITMSGKYKSSSKNGECGTKTVVAGDSWGSLAGKCETSIEELLDYNAHDEAHSWPLPGSEVCCTNGALADTQPRPDDNGFCANYTIRSGDTCSSIAVSYGLNESDISHFNDKTTWGWFGCESLLLGLRICLSEGSPPIPAPVSNAVCGPTRPGTEMPGNQTRLAELNPCPLNACCTIWGICRITPEYCTSEDGPRGNPGTAPPGHNGCISNCGVSITNNLKRPSDFLRVSYYESWNLDRPCLNLQAKNINATEYTHIHWAFATIDRNFHISINDPYHQWDGFMTLKGVKRIISLGGWGQSNSMFRTAIDPENVDFLVQNLVKFVQKEKVDGIDLDWEYPMVSKLSNIVPILRSDGPNYLAFLRKLKTSFSNETVVSMAAPASYWYLRAFPIAEMSNYLNYIIYMTYDFHGQWDYDSDSEEGNCRKGSCLRSHGKILVYPHGPKTFLSVTVNLTETQHALSMITKAGVPASKVMVGVTSYGRSFGMTEKGCTGPECTFEGPGSTAKRGNCTGLVGIIANAELEDLIRAGRVNESFYDKASDSNILVYDDTQWVSYMNRSTKARRIEYYERLNFSGYVDWAVDLAEGSAYD